jgi:S-adenosylmethionine:tRNA ribosyltransferase-isomerase
VGVEVFCLEPYEPAEYQGSFSARSSCSWVCIVGNLKRWKDEVLKLQFYDNQKNNTLFLKKMEVVKDGVIVNFSWDNQDLTFADVLERCGAIPIPPYLNRKEESSDYEQYQTVYSKFQGSVAAPTAGLHFTNEVFDNLKKKSIDLAEVTLHVGAGTFRPVKTESIAEHIMHAEHFEVNIETLKRLQKAIGSTIAIGTTSVRTLESVYWIGANLIKNKILLSNIEQWKPYDKGEEIDVGMALESLINYLINNGLTLIKASTQILLTPPYKFKVVNGLITKFHQPKRTLLQLVSSMVGERWRDIYDYALEHDFRFLSYGDSSLIFP